MLVPSVLALVLTPGPAYAQSSPLELEWSAPATCPDGKAVRVEVERILATTEGASQKVIARGSVERRSETSFVVWLATLVEGEARSRTFEAESCDAAVDAAALILALSINPYVTIDTSPPPPPGPAPPKRSPPPRRERLERGASAAPPKVKVGGAVLLDVGTLPSPLLGGEASLGVTTGPVRWELAGASWLPQNATSATYPRDGARARLLTLDLRAAFRWKFGDVAILPFVSIRGTRALVAGFGGVARVDAAAEWLGLGMGSFVAWSPKRWFEAQFGAGVNVPFGRPSFVVLETTTHVESPIFRVGAVAGQTTLGIAARF
ncbi:MAG TPA: hypothetical protein VJN18_10720 [Polyangiaceae bacterium]|nr:hypothetical protein [Polyangiaceae bacterium]